MKYFPENVKTLEELRKNYKELLKKYHPDNPNGSTEVTKLINLEYEKLFQILKDRHESAKDEKQSTYEKMKFNFEDDVKLREALQKIIFFAGINIEIIGCWIWVDGNTYPYKQKLNEYGFGWARDKKKWYFHTEPFQKKGNKKLTMEEIRNLFNSEKFETDSNKLLKA